MSVADDFLIIPERFSNNSPSGGPTGHPGAVVLIAYRAAGIVRWKQGGDTHDAATIQPVETDDTKEGGPTPLGEYLIGERYVHEQLNRDWYRLYPRKEDSSGYYPYTARTQTDRDRMGLHPGSISEGCTTIAVPGATSGAEASSHPNWLKVRDYLETGSMTYRGSSYKGFLYVVS